MNLFNNFFKRIKQLFKTNNIEPQEDFEEELLEAGGNPIGVVDERDIDSEIEDYFGTGYNPHDDVEIDIDSEGAGYF